MEDRSPTLQALRGSKEAERGKRKPLAQGSNGASKGRDLELVNENQRVLQRKFQRREHSL